MSRDRVRVRPQRHTFFMTKSQADYILSLIEDDIEDFGDEMEESERWQAISLRNRLCKEVLDRPERNRR
jgi:hypothetical protein